MSGILGFRLVQNGKDVVFRNRLTVLHHRKFTLQPGNFAGFLAGGAAVTGERLAEAHALAIHARGEIEGLLKQVDVLIAPSATGEAPLGLDATGNPIFSRMWSLLGVPCVHVPTGVGSHGMPVGVTVIGPRWRDAKALSAALALEAAVKG